MQILEGHASDIGGEQTVSQKIERERAFGGLVVKRRAISDQDSTSSNRGHTTISNCCFKRRRRNGSPQGKGTISEQHSTYSVFGPQNLDQKRVTNVPPISLIAAANRSISQDQIVHLPQRAVVVAGCFAIGIEGLLQ
jgi:hypothetical protein